MAALNLPPVAAVQPYVDEIRRPVFDIKADTILNVVFLPARVLGLTGDSPLVLPVVLGTWLAVGYYLFFHKKGTS